MASQPLTTVHQRLLDYYLASKRVMVWLIFAVVWANIAVIIANVAWLASSDVGISSLRRFISVPPAAGGFLEALTLPALMIALAASGFCGVKAWRSRQSAKRIAGDLARYDDIHLQGRGAADEALRLARSLSSSSAAVPPTFRSC